MWALSRPGEKWTTCEVLAQPEPETEGGCRRSRLGQTLMQMLHLVQRWLSMISITNASA
jgi:hypothetical protein